MVKKGRESMILCNGKRQTDGATRICYTDRSSDPQTDRQTDRQKSSIVIEAELDGVESGEKCYKYFFNLSKRSKKHITKVKPAEGSVTEDPKVMLRL